jgi:hypothetical protein
LPLIAKIHEAFELEQLRIDAIALVLTILMTVTTLWITIDTLNAFNRMLNATLNGSID